jgi:ABC-type antimicrobial peptide transport system permease subunit
MLTTERTREFRTMISLGMSRKQLQGVVALELLFMTFIGLVAGIAISLPIAYYFYANPIQITGELATSFLDMGMEPIIPFSIEPQIFISQVIIVLLISIIAVLYPLQKIKKLKLT